MINQNVDYEMSDSVRYHDTDTGAHFEFNDLCLRLRKVQVLRGKCLTKRVQSSSQKKD